SSRHRKQQLYLIRMMVFRNRGLFHLKTSMAQILALVDKDGRCAIKLSGLGQMVGNGATESEARVESFLGVPLYSAICEKYKGRNLPTAKALAREMKAIGFAS
ncbi:MAG: hypothetical protein AAF850_03440, partial [Pseudomonadota bacterium]